MSVLELKLELKELFGPTTCEFEINEIYECCHYLNELQTVFESLKLMGLSEELCLSIKFKLDCIADYFCVKMYKKKDKTQSEKESAKNE